MKGMYELGGRGFVLYTAETIAFLTLTGFPKQSLSLIVPWPPMAVIWMTLQIAQTVRLHLDVSAGEEV